MTSSILLIKAAVSLPALALEYGVVIKNHMAQCCFHKDKTPSLSIRDEFFCCHGCGARGDVITFLAKIEGVSVGRALRMLSLRTGIPLDGKPMTRVERVYGAQEQAFALWWWKRATERLAVRLTAYVRLGTESEAEEAGALWRSVAQVPRAQLRALVERCATVEDREEWRREAPREKEFEEWRTHWLRGVLASQRDRAALDGYKDYDDCIRKFGPQSFLDMMQHVVEVPTNEESLMRMEREGSRNERPDTKLTA